MRFSKWRLGAVLGAALIVASIGARAQSTVPVAPRPCDVATVTTGGTAVTAFSGPANGFLLQNPTGASEALLYNVTGTASTTQGGGTFGLAAGSSVLFNTALSAGASLSVNAATSAHAFSCARW